MKGRSNYACRQKIYDAEKEPMLIGPGRGGRFPDHPRLGEDHRIRRPRRDQDAAGSSSAWAKVDARSDLCTGQKCKQFERCFITLMHQRAVESDIIIVNHHLFFADLALKDEQFEGGILPEYHAVVFDEAHEIEDVAGQYFGMSGQQLSVPGTAPRYRRRLAAEEFGSPELDRILDRLEEISRASSSPLRRFEGRTGFTGRDAFLEQNRETLRRSAGRARTDRLASEADQESAGRGLCRCTGARRKSARRCKFMLESDDPSFVYWMERRGRGVLPAGHADRCRRRFWPSACSIDVDTVILTSATLAVAGGFDFVEKRLGLQHARTLIVPGHFDYQKQALLYVPQHLPDPRSPAFPTAASDEVAAHPEAQPRARVRAVHQLSADAH